MTPWQKKPYETIKIAPIGPSKKLLPRHRWCSVIIIVFIRYFCYVSTMSNMNLIEIDVWSDIQCPFCYIGKRQLEQALAAYEHRDRVRITWRSYQLDPGLVPREGESIYQYLSRRLSVGEASSKAMHVQVARTAQAHGLVYNFDTMVVANTASAHRLIQVARGFGLAMHLEEALFKAYFTDGKDVGDHRVLGEIAGIIGVPRDAIEAALKDEDGLWSRKVMDDAIAAREAGCKGVPFFVINGSRTISGAQGAERLLSGIASN